MATAPAISIPRLCTAAGIEAALQLAHADGPTTLRLPTTLAKRAGTEAALVQLVHTWSQRKQHAVLRTYIASGPTADKDMLRFCNSVHGLAAILCASDVVDQGGENSLRSIANDAARKVVTLMEGHEARFQHGRAFASLCPDRTSRALNPDFYDPSDGRVRYHGQFEDLLRHALWRAEGNTELREPIEALLRPISRILYEAFKNTDEWGRTTTQGVPIRRSVRGMVVRGISGDGDDIAEDYELGDPIGAFMIALAARRGHSRVRAIELSIIDGGPGLVRRFAVIDDLAGLSLDDEARICLECFSKHQTSSGAHHRGVGLSSMFTALTALGGFIRLRTGRMLLSRDFGIEPMVSDDDLRLKEWQTSDAKRGYADVAGTAITCLIPVGGRPVHE